MTKIKSSLEIALERTAHVASDPAQIEAARYRQQGKKLVIALQQKEGTESGFEEYRRCSETDRASMRRGMHEVLRNIIALPFSFDDLERYTIIERVLAEIAPTYDGAAEMVQRLEGVGHRYLEEREELVAMLHDKYQRIAMEKMRMLQQQTGMPMRIDPAAMPEFQQEQARMLQQHTQRFSAAVDEIRAQLDAVFSQS